MRLVIILSIFMVLASKDALAQEDIGTADLLEFVDSRFLSLEELPIINVDDANQILHYYEPDGRSWTQYAYPTDLDEIGNTSSHIRLRSDGTYMINTSGFWAFSSTLARETWIFDPTTVTFTRPSAVCNGWVQALHDEAQWIIIETEGSYRLCNTETNEVSSAIPYQADDGYCPNQWRKPIDTSPDEQYILFFCGGTEFDAYSYNVQQEDFTRLGNSTVRQNENVEIVRWLSDTKAIIHTYPSWNPPANSYYVVNVASEGGLEFIHSDLYAAPLYFNDPPRIEWMPCEFSRCGVIEVDDETASADSPESSVSNSLHQYNFLSGELVIYPNIENINGVSALIPDGSGDRIYRHLNYVEETVFQYTAPSATLIRFNYETKQTTEIYTGEIEWMESFSPDGRYLVLEIGDNDEVASSFLLAENQAGYDPVGRAGLAILDLQTNALVYEATGSQWGLDEFGLDPLSLTWIDSDRFLIHGVDENFDQLVELGDTIEILATFRNASTLLSPDHRLVLIRNDDTSLSLYRIDTQEIIQVIDSSALDNYGISSYWLTNQQILLTITDDNYVMARWIIDFSKPG
ncbi:MAG: hypothetical protein KC708_09260 [Anaerolineae bacterium]|nr:hypothetical protein [Anaerolineae bacterium]